MIAEFGGMLSHSSIVDCEYNLPTVVSVKGACRLLADDQIVSVDVYELVRTIVASLILGEDWRWWSQQVVM